ncbi:MAG TPA: hypothetical protein EYP29_04630, partial [Thermoplasmata archaeon]|nr:hypothetical protein [Thermoplasmata archaeon]
MKVDYFLKKENSKKLVSFITVFLLVATVLVVLFVGKVETSSIELVLTDSSSKGVRPGDSVDYQFKLKNTGDSSQRVEISVLGVPEHWRATLDLPQNLVRLKPRSSTIFYLSVKAPEEDVYPLAEGYALITVEARGGENRSLQTTLTYFISKLFYKKMGDEKYFESKDGKVSLENGISLKTDGAGMYSVSFDKPGIATMTLNRNSEITVDEMSYTPGISKRVLRFTIEEGSVGFYVKLPTTDSFLSLDFTLNNGKRYGARVLGTTETIFKFTFLNGKNNFAIKTFLGQVKLIYYGGRAPSIEKATIPAGSSYSEGDEKPQTFIYNLLKVETVAEGDLEIYKDKNFVGAEAGGSFVHEIENLIYIVAVKEEGAQGHLWYVALEDEGTGLSGEYSFKILNVETGEKMVKLTLTRYDKDKYGGEMVTNVLEVSPEENAYFSFAVNNEKNELKIISSRQLSYTLSLFVDQKLVFKGTEIKISNYRHLPQIHSF